MLCSPSTRGGVVMNGFYVGALVAAVIAAGASPAAAQSLPSVMECTVETKFTDPLRGASTSNMTMRLALLSDRVLWSSGGGWSELLRGAVTIQNRVITAKETRTSLSGTDEQTLRLDLKDGAYQRTSWMGYSQGLDTGRCKNARAELLDEALLNVLLRPLSYGLPDYELMTPSLAADLKAQTPPLQDIMRPYGLVELMRGGREEKGGRAYRVWYTSGVVDWRIHRDRSGRVSGLWYTVVAAPRPEAPPQAAAPAEKSPPPTW